MRELIRVQNIASAAGDLAVRHVVSAALAKVACRLVRTCHPASAARGLLQNQRLQRKPVTVAAMAVCRRTICCVGCLGCLLAVCGVPSNAACIDRSVQVVRQAAAAAEALVDGDAVTAWRLLPQLHPVDPAGCQIDDQVRSELHNLVAAAAMRVAALSLPPPELSAESMTTLAAAELSSSLQLRPDAAEPNWNAALLAGMAEGATGTWEQTPPLEGPPLLHSAAHGSLFLAASSAESPEFLRGSERLAICLRHLRRPSVAARTAHGGLLADGGNYLGTASALWAFATTVGRTTAQRVLPSDPRDRQMLSMLLATDLPADGSEEAEAARIHSQLVSVGALPIPDLGPREFFVSWGVRASLERWHDMSSCATVNHERLIHGNFSTDWIRGACQPTSSYVLRMGPTKRGHWWRAHAVQGSAPVGSADSYTVKWTADGAFGAASSPVVVVATVNPQAKGFDGFVRSIDDAAQHARSLMMQMYPTASQNNQDYSKVVVVVQATGAPLNQSYWQTNLKATILLEMGLPDDAEWLPPTGFLRAVITSDLLSEALDAIMSAEDVKSVDDALNDNTANVGGKQPLVVWVGPEGIHTTMPIEFFASLEQHVVHGQRVYCPIGTATSELQRPVESPLYREMPLESAAPVIGARLEDMQSAVLRPGMKYWTANGAWVGSESWALLRALSLDMGLQIARPRELALRFAVHSEFGDPSWWSAAARTGLCVSEPTNNKTRYYHHHPGLLSRASLQGVRYYDSGGLPAPPATQDKVSMNFIQTLSREAADNPRGSSCRFQIDDAGLLTGSLSHQITEDSAVEQNLRCASLPLGQNRPVECRLALLKLMSTASSALSASGVIHWLEFGTLLGALREHDIIAHTNDAEIGSLFSKKADILAMRSGLLDCGVEMHNRAHSNERNGVGVVDYVELFDRRYISANGEPEIKLDITLRLFMPINQMTEDGVPTRALMLVDPTDNFANTVRSAVSPSEILPLQRCEVGGVGFPCPNDGVTLVKRYYGDDCMDVVKRHVHVAANGDGDKHVNVMMSSEL